MHTAERKLIDTTGDPQQFSLFLRSVREFFLSRNLAEVITPSLTEIPSYELGGSNFSVQGKWLRTSPEIEMKLLVAKHKADIFQVGPAFRRGDIGPIHKEEFSMLEWYRVGSHYTDLMQETTDFIDQSLRARKVTVLNRQFLSYRQAFLQNLSLDPFLANDNEILAQASQRGLVGTVNYKTALDFLFDQATRRFPPHSLTAVFDFPLPQSSFAKINDQNQAMRFEVFHGGTELANGCQELTSPKEYCRRFAEHIAALAPSDRALATDQTAVERFIKQLKYYGMPCCSGVSIGLERVYSL